MLLIHALFSLAGMKLLRSNRLMGVDNGWPAPPDEDIWPSAPAASKDDSVAHYSVSVPLIPTATSAASNGPTRVIATHGRRSVSTSVQKATVTVQCKGPQPLALPDPAACMKTWCLFNLTEVRAAVLHHSFVIGTYEWSSQDIPESLQSCCLSFKTTE